jgi:hypothetical protein
MWHDDIIDADIGVWPIILALGGALHLGRCNDANNRFLDFVILVHDRRRRRGTAGANLFLGNLFGNLLLAVVFIRRLLHGVPHRFMVSASRRLACSRPGTFVLTLDYRDSTSDSSSLDGDGKMAGLFSNLLGITQLILQGAATAGLSSPLLNRFIVI